MSVARRITRNISANYVGVVGQLAIAFLLTPFLLHSLGDERYGIWSIISAFTGYLLLFDLGVVSAITKYTAQYRASGDNAALRRLLGSAAVLVVPITLLLVLASPFLGHLLIAIVNIDPSLHDVVRLSAMLATLEVATFVFSGLSRGVLFGHQRYDITNLIQLTTAVLKAALLYSVLSMGHGLVAMSTVAWICGIFLATSMWAAVRHVDPASRVRLADADRATTSDISTFSRATFLSMVAGQVIYYSDAFVIGYFLSAAAVTYYSLAWSLSEYVNRLMVVASKTFIPVFSELSLTSADGRLYDTYLRATRYQLIISNLVCTGMFVLGGSFLSLWVGEQYAAISTPLLLILFISQAVRGPQLVSYALLQGIGQHRSYARFDLCFAVGNLLLNIVLIQHVGLIGVAIATATTQFLFFGLLVPVLTLRKLGKPLSGYLQQTYMPMLVPTAALALTLLAASHQFPVNSFPMLFLQAGSGTLVYALAIWHLTLNRDERNFLADRLRQRLQRAPRPVND